ncbi:hypothetical protein DTO027B5_3003 [Paecilomyces variotii]|nr:hypothetical protein DTO027B3_8462 [Paecilomyces variotii]KAJ9335307.1 hypothetical protein DTO027B5_3003 [Paecilomyces variotii]
MDTDVVIVGGGPSGLVLGLCLAASQIKSVILEKQRDITTDPRGVVLTGDAVRSLWKLGLGKRINWIGQELRYINFHDTKIQNKPFLSIHLDYDMMEHVLPSTILQSQPRLEYALRELVAKSEYCTLKNACEVVGREEDVDGVTVRYLDVDRTAHEIRAPWLVGADGKRGIVRKHFLEASAGVRQEAGIFEYEGTWIAANLKLTLPTEDSHPDLPLWAVGYDSEGIYDLFWPKDWHFCRPPGRPVACGRFGPVLERLWRHEFAIPEWDDSMDASKLFWEHLTPMITRSIKGPDGKQTPVTFPRDCIEVLRCRPFRFSHKVVNKWFSGRTMLIGDAAHVFPPFGGQGVACGVLDADNLAWRLAVMTKMEQSGNSSPALRNSLLQSWADERRLGVNNSARLTLQNGKWCNNDPTWTGNLRISVVQLVQFLFRVFSVRLPLPQVSSDARGYQSCPQGAFLAAFDGGTKVGQIYVQTLFPATGSMRIELSDQALRRVPTILTLLVIHSDQPHEDADLEHLLGELKTDPKILSVESIVHFNLAARASFDSCAGRQSVSFPAPQSLLAGYPVRPGYDANQFMRRVGDSRARYLILRPDNIIYAKARTLKSLKRSLELLEANFPQAKSIDS